MSNVVLIGMPGCGKSTVGVLLAKSLLKEFVDTDLVIQNRYGVSLCELIRRHGVEGFKAMENECLSALKLQNCVIATGGSAVYGEDAMRTLKQNGTVIYLNVSPTELTRRLVNITTRGIAMSDGCTVEQLHAERAPLYERYADYTIDADKLSAEACVNTIIEVLRT